jgi:tripartite-type tricarboxylate transporter receptor subunit TctC
VGPLAITSATRSEALPDVPTVSEFVPCYEASAWLGFGAPKDTPASIIDMLNSEVNAGLADPLIKARLAGLRRHGASRLSG